MPGVDLTQLSSNWKILQGRLGAGKKQTQSENGLKRKRNGANDEGKTTDTSIKKPRISFKDAAIAAKRRRMGLAWSQPAAPTKATPTTTTTTTITNTRSKLLMDHDIAPEDVAAAYGGSGAGRSYKDDINGGLETTHKPGRFVALDCEMVGTGPPPHSDNVLARASLVNYHGEQIYDSYVLAPPGVHVEDYRTFVSGIKRSHMVEGFARPFAQVQREVSTLLEGRVLVGHALRNDLQVLLLSHPKRDVRDTSRHPKFREASMGKAPALRKLAKEQLGMVIQTGEHSSVEDARASMLLFRKEKAGFEAENIKHFGQSSRFALNPSKPSKTGAAAEDEDDDAQEDEDDDELDEEFDDDGNLVSTKGDGGGAATKTKKKRKKKKRTKR